MKLSEMIEAVRQHHPKMTEAEVIKLLNQGMDNFAAKTRIVKGSYTFETVIDQRYYTLDPMIIEIMEVAYDAGTSKGRIIPRLINRPDERDVT